LQPGGVDTFNVITPQGAEVVIQSSAVTSTLGAREMILTGPGGFSIESPTGIIGPFVGRPDVLTLQVSQLVPGSGGQYTVELNVVSEDASNCGQPLQCGATPDGTSLAVPGEVDSFQTPPLVVGHTAIFKVNWLQNSGGPRVRLYDPSGTQVTDSCAGTIQVQPTVPGIYTALVFAGCGTVDTGYRIEFFDSGCPIGATITEFGMANAESEIQSPIGLDSNGRPIFKSQRGAGLVMVVEARAGAGSPRGSRPGQTTLSQSGGMFAPGDLQVIMSRDLGNGDPTVCDIRLPDIGGVAATVPFAFQDTQQADDIIADMGCRFDDGTGAPSGRPDSTDACTRTNQGDFSFVDRASAIQYCAQIDTAWAFPPGDTIVAARVRDTAHNFGASREIVVRVGDATSTPTPTATFPPPSLTATRTSTPTPHRTPTPPITERPTATFTRTRTGTATRTQTATPTGPTPTATMTPSGGVPTFTPGIPCVGDCDHTHNVTVSDITLMVNIALGHAMLSDCPAGDGNGDGTIGIGDLVISVTNALSGCPSTGN
jgi:hypothetical protein